MFALSVGAVRSSIPKKKVIGPSATALDRTRMLECIRGARVRCTAVLGQTSSTIGHLLVLEAGDLLRLDGAPDQPIDIRVGDTTVLRGKPVLQHGNLAVQVSSDFGTIR
jgi:flagellar motor switch/type III secretory pathway protein FliN